MLKAISGIFGGGGFRAVENIAREWIETDTEKAEAKTLMIKTLDPNGLMRRNLADEVSSLYTLYVLVTLVLLVLEAFGVGPVVEGQKLAVSVATEKVTDLFTPITTLFGVIVSASFGVNYVNASKGQ